MYSRPVHTYGSFRFFERFNRAAGRENPIGVLEADNLVNLEEVDSVRLQACQRLIDLFGGLLPRAAVHFGHEKDLFVDSRP